MLEQREQFSVDYVRPCGPIHGGKLHNSMAECIPSCQHMYSTSSHRGLLIFFPQKCYLTKDDKKDFFECYKKMHYSYKYTCFDIEITVKIVLHVIV